MEITEEAVCFDAPTLLGAKINTPIDELLSARFHNVNLKLLMSIGSMWTRGDTREDTGEKPVRVVS